MSGSKLVAQRGGRVAGNARIETEKEIGRGVVTGKNYRLKTRKIKVLG